MSQTPSAKSNVFSALAYGDFRRFASSLLLTSMGVQLLQTAVLWQVYELTGSALLLGLSGLARAAPHMVLSLVGGVIADRLNRVRLIQAGQVANAVLVLTLAVLALTGAVEVWHLYVITFLNSAFTAVSQPARTALIPSLVPQENLVNAVALNATIGQTSQIIGPALAGVAIATVGLGFVYLLNGLLYLAAMAAIIGVVSSSVSSQTPESPWRSFMQGMIFVRSKPVIVSLLLLDLGATGLGSYRALLPIFAEMLGAGAAGYGLLSAAPGIGSLLGAGIMLSLGDMKYKGLYTIFGVLAYSGALAILALSPWFLLTLVAASLLGTTNSIQMIPRNSVILAISPDSLRGRVEAFRSMMAGGGPPLGYTLSGGLAAVLGPPLAVVIGAVACAVLVAVVSITRPELRDPHLGSTTNTKT
ncbi:MAG: MFS transporter [Chloroflexi bacterium]|nr:MFS transporter [Chloroflexota bacterium]